MKKIIRSLVAMFLAFAIALTCVPQTAEAAGVKLTKATSGKVSAVYYKGAKAKKASFSMNSVFAYQYNGYNVYNVKVTLKRPKLSKNDIVNTVKESTKKKGKISDYSLIFVDGKGNQISPIFDGTMNYSESSASKTLTASTGRSRYYIYGWRSKTVYDLQVAVPAGTSDVYVGFAGLRSGQLKKKTAQKYTDGKINYYSAGFGKNKKGFAIAGSIM